MSKNQSWDDRWGRQLAARNAALNARPVKAEAPAAKAKAPISRKTPSSNAVKSSPKLTGNLAQAINRLLKGIQAGKGIKILKSNGNILISAAGEREGGDPAASSAEELHYDDGTVKIDIDGNGIVMEMLWNGDKIIMDQTNARFRMYDASSGNYITLNTADAFYGAIEMRLTGLYDGGVPVSAYVFRTPTF